MNEILNQLERTTLYSEELGINLSRRAEGEYFKWFLASLLFGGRISETIARNTYTAFVHHRLTTPRKILLAGRDFLINPLMREGGYVRYDGRKSDQILKDCRTLLDDYRGRLSNLHSSSRDSEDLENRLDAFYGVGPITANIFLREMRPYWAKADPPPVEIVAELARNLGIDLQRYNRKTMRFVRMEAGLIRMRRKPLAVSPGTGKRSDPAPFRRA